MKSWRLFDKKLIGLLRALARGKVHCVRSPSFQEEARRYPLINLLEDKDHIYIEALTPGVDPQSLNVSVTHNRLTMAGEKTRISGDVKPEAFHRSERASGKFVRTFDLPVEVDDAGVQAEYKNGLLLVTIPKAEKAKPKQINVKIA